MYSTSSSCYYLILLYLTFFYIIIIFNLYIIILNISQHTKKKTKDYWKDNTKSSQFGEDTHLLLCSTLY